MEDLENERYIGPAEAARWCDFVCMHGYPVYADWSTGPTDQHLVPFLAEITRWLAADVPVLFAEFGQSTTTSTQPPAGLQVSEGDAARYTATTLDALARRRIDRRTALVLRRLRRRSCTGHPRSTSRSTSGPLGCGVPTGRRSRRST